MTQNKHPDQLLRVGQEVSVKDNRKRSHCTRIKSIDYMDNNNEYPYRFHLENGEVIYNSNYMEWVGKPKIKPEPYIPRQWDKNQKVKFMPYSSLSLKPEYGIIQDSKDGIVTILTQKGAIIQIPEVNILSSG